MPTLVPISLIRMAIAFAGILVILISALVAIAHVILAYFYRKENALTINQIRLQLGYGIILGLEFIVAADAVESIVRPDYYDLGILGGLVVIRIFLSYFLNKELEQLSPEERRKFH